MPERVPTISSQKWRRHRVAVGGHTIVARVRGDGPPFHWCHGVTSSSLEDLESPFHPSRALGDDWQLVLVDACGHGASTADEDPAAYRWDRFAADLLATADALGHGSILVGGTSMGAAVALHAAVAAPRRVAGLVLVLAPTYGDERAAQRDEYLADAAVADELGAAALADRVVERPLPAILARLVGESDGGASGSRRRLAALDPAVVPAILRGAAASDLPDADALRRVRAPALVLGWDGDPGHPLSTVRHLVEVLPEVTSSVAHEPRDLLGWPAAISDFCTTLRARLAVPVR